MAITQAWVPQEAICRALGIDPTVTSRVVIDMPAEGPARIRITQFMTVDQAAALERVFVLTNWTETESE